MVKAQSAHQTRISTGLNINSTPLETAADTPEDPTMPLEAAMSACYIAIVPMISVRQHMTSKRELGGPYRVTTSHDMHSAACVALNF